MKTVFTRFGFADTDIKRPIGEFSGGQKTRIAFVKLLLSKPDILLLDEPTNHLDLETIKWLEGYVRKYPNAVVTVSHDRMFLDHTSDVVYDMEYGKLTRYFTQCPHRFSIVHRVHRGIDAPRRNGIDPNAGQTDFFCQRLGQADQTGLGGGIRHLARSTAHAPYRGDVEDTAVTAAQHIRQHRTTEIKRAVHVDAQHLEIVAAVGAADGAGIALAAVEIGIHSDLVTDFQTLLVVLGDGENLTGQLMADDAGIGDQTVGAAESADIRAADAAGNCVFAA